MIEAIVIVAIIYIIVKVEKLYKDYE